MQRASAYRLLLKKRFLRDQLWSRLSIENSAFERKTHQITMNRRSSCDTSANSAILRFILCFGVVWSNIKNMHCMVCKCETHLHIRLVLVVIAICSQRRTDWKARRVEELHPGSWEGGGRRERRFPVPAFSMAPSSQTLRAAAPEPACGAAGGKQLREGW